MEEYNELNEAFEKDHKQECVELELSQKVHSECEKFDEKLDEFPEDEKNEDKKAIVSKKLAKKMKSAVVSLKTRTVVVVCSLLLISLAVVLNFALSGNNAPIADDGEFVISSSDDEPLYVEDTYFASSVLSREQARDEAIEVLKTVVNNEATLEDAREAALEDIARIADAIESEANIETLVKSKGFEECIAVVTGANANIIVKSDGLMPNELSQIKEIVYEQAGIDPVNIKIVEKS